MRRMAIDFAPPSWQRALRRTPAFFWLIGLAGAGLCGGLALHASAESARHAALQAELDGVQARLAMRLPRTALRPAQALPETKVRAMNDLVMQLNLPWPAVLDALQAAGGPSVALLELHTDAKARLVKGGAEARNAAAMLAYMERLRAQPLVDHARLSKHEVNTQDTADPMRFEFAMRWRDEQP